MKLGGIFKLNIECLKKRAFKKSHFYFYTNKDKPRNDNARQDQNKQDLHEKTRIIIQ